MRGSESESESDQSFVLTQKKKKMTLHRKEKKRKKKKKKKTNSYWAKSAFRPKLTGMVGHPETDRNFIRGGTSSITIPDYILE